MEVFAELNREGKTIILITHEQDIAAFAERRVLLPRRPGGRGPARGDARLEEPS